jgi:hypothetical protein
MRRRHGIDPQRYLTQLLTNLPATPISQISQWLPDRWGRRNLVRRGSSPVRALLTVQLRLLSPSQTKILIQLRI